MKALSSKLKAVSLISLCLLLVGCKKESPLPPVVVATAPSQDETLSKVSAAVGQLRKDNEQNPEGPAKQAVELQGRIAASGLPGAKPTDAADAAETSALVFAGQLEKAIKRATLAEITLDQLKERSAKEQAESKKRLDDYIAEAERRVQAANDEAQHKAYLLVVGAFAVIGGAITVGGVVCAVTGWSRIGVLAIPAGILIGGSGLLWGKPWFLWTVGSGVILSAIAMGIYWAVTIYERKGAPTNSAAGVTPGG